MRGTYAWSPTANPNFSYYMTFNAAGIFEDRDLSFLDDFPKIQLCNDVVKACEKIENRVSTLEEGTIPKTFQVRSLNLK